MLRHRQDEFDDPFNPFIRQSRERFDRAADDVAYARELAVADGIPEEGSDKFRLHRTRGDRLERLFPMVSFRLADGYPCALLTIVHADSENTRIVGEDNVLIGLRSGRNYGSLSRVFQRTQRNIAAEEASILKMQEPDGTPKGIRGADHIEAAHQKIDRLQKTVGQLETAAKILERVQPG